MSELLKNWRTRESLTTDAAASRAGVTGAMWSRWENGRRKVPPERVLEIERLTGVSRHDLRPDVFGAAPVEAAE